MTDANDSIQWSVESMTSSWLKRTIAGDAQAWERLNSAYQKLILWWCLRGQIPAQDAGDIAQQVMLDVRRAIANYRQASFRGWLWTITKRRIADYWRKRTHEPSAVGGSGIQDLLHKIEVESSTSTLGVNPATKILFDAIVAFIADEFSEVHWRAFWKVVVEEKSATEVASELGITRTVVHNATSRIRRRIRQEFCDYLSNDPPETEQPATE